MAATTSITTRALAGISLFNGNKGSNKEVDNLTLKRWEEYCSRVVTILVALLGIVSSILVIGSCGVFQTTYQLNSSLSDEPQRVDSLRTVYVGVFRLSTAKAGSSSDQCVPFSSLADLTGWDEVVNDPRLMAAQWMAVLSPCIAAIATFLLLPLRWTVPLSIVGLLYAVAGACQIFILILLEFVQFWYVHDLLRPLLLTVVAVATANLAKLFLRQSLFPPYSSGEGSFGTCQLSSGGGWTCVAAFLYVVALWCTWMVRRCRQKADRLDHCLVHDPILHLVVPSFKTRNSDRYDPTLTVNKCIDEEMGSTDANIDPYASVRNCDTTTTVNDDDSFLTNPIAVAPWVIHSEEVSVLTTNTLGGNTQFLNDYDGNDETLPLSMIATTSSSSSTATNSTVLTMIGVNPSLLMEKNHHDTVVTSVMEGHEVSQTRKDESMEEISYLMFPNFQVRDGSPMDHDELDSIFGDTVVVDSDTVNTDNHGDAMHQQQGLESTSTPVNQLDTSHIVAPDDEKQDFIRSQQACHCVSSIDMQVMMDDQTVQSLSLPATVTSDACLNQDETLNQSHHIYMDNSEDDSNPLANDEKHTDTTTTTIASENVDEGADVTIQQDSQSSFYDALEMMSELDRLLDDDSTTDTSLGIYQFTVSELQLDESRQSPNDEEGTLVAVQKNEAQPMAKETDIPVDDDPSIEMIQDKEKTGEQCEGIVHHEPGFVENESQEIRIAAAVDAIESPDIINEMVDQGDQSERGIHDHEEIRERANHTDSTDVSPDPVQTNQDEEKTELICSDLHREITNQISSLSQSEVIQSATGLFLHPGRGNDEGHVSKVHDKETRQKPKKTKKKAKLIADNDKENHRTTSETLRKETLQFRNEMTNEVQIID